MWYMAAPGRHSVADNRISLTHAETCTIGVVMVGHLPKSQLPGAWRVQRLLSDVGTWEEVWTTAKLVYQRCVIGGNRPGWTTLGKHSFSLLLDPVSISETPNIENIFDVGAQGGIGVFFWPTDSWISRAVETRDWPP